ncbi:MAG: HipA domain-containing protein [Deltaproteobacteria bacterium]|jgi:serine/threonine-protein kinase HipA|nr:HipA domain-containing protein [Deltaproteobacteria bacterium]
MDQTLLINKIDELIVVWDNKFVGSLYKDLKTRDIAFRYDGDWIKRVRVPISLSLPLRDGEFNHAETAAFFGNLLPGGEAMTSLCQYHNLPENDIFASLTHFGRDCPGALIITNVNYKLNEENNNYWDITNIIHKGFRTNDFSRLYPLLRYGQGPDLSEAHYKLPLVYEKGSFYVPSFLSYAPTTHELKFSLREFKNLCLNEAFCLEMAKFINLPVPAFEILEFYGNYGLLIERVDRGVDPAGKVKRRHRENFCQALGYGAAPAPGQPTPGYRDCCKVINSLKVRNQDNALTDFTKLSIFNFLIGNSHQNARDFSVIYNLSPQEDNDYYLTVSPFQDLVASRVYQPLSPKLSMPIGRADYYDILDDIQFKTFLSDINASVDSIVDCLISVISPLKQFFLDISDEADFLFGNANLHNRLRHIFGVNSMKLINIVSRLNDGQDRIAD